ncbi:hypothetical protein BH09MYX1_BH09MYX1_60300 [soil metagenome]
MPERLWGSEGVVLGRARLRNGTWDYGVQVRSDDDIVWQLPERALRSKGRKLSHEDVYTGETVKVPAPGRGKGDLDS